MPPLIKVALMLTHFAFDTYITILLVRYLLQKVGANWYNPVSQLIIKLTSKPLKIFQFIIPGKNKLNYSIIIFAIILQLIETALLWRLKFGYIPNMPGILIISFSQLISKLITIYIYAIIINALTSWVPAMQNNPLSGVIYLIVDPVLSQIRRIIPLIANIDISPIFALLGLTVLNILIVGVLFNIGTKIILGG